MKNIVFIILLSISFSSSAQINSAIGAIGAKEGIGLTYKRFVDAHRFLDFNLFGNYSENLQGALFSGYHGWHNEFQSSTLHTTSLSWFYGLGFHAGYYSLWSQGDSQNLVVGPSGNLGIEYNHRDFLIAGVFGRLFYHALHTAELRESDDYIDFGVTLRYVLD